MMITVSKEDYLKAIATAEAEGVHVIPATIANWLGVTRPAVTAALKRLKRDRMVRVGEDGRVQLTSAGRQVAERTLFRHHLIERMLTEIFEMPWCDVPQEAERLEHVVSASFEKRLVEKLGKNDVCPHGNSSSVRSDSERRKRGLRPLNEAEEGKKYQVKSVYERDVKLLQFFDQEGIRPGIAVAIEAKDYDGTTTLGIGSRSLRLGLPAAQKVWVAKLK
jgi:DtxR family Mn-dependent transcriptional regulator